MDGAHVEVDDLHGFLSDTPLEEAIPIGLENAVPVTSNPVERGFDVVVTYPLSTAASSISPRTSRRSTPTSTPWR